MDTDHLRTALALSEQGTVNRTAAALGLAPSSVSDRIRRLETELGAPLFTRGPAGMRPTAAGRTYLAAAARALSALDNAATVLATPRALAVGAQASVADLVLPAVVARLARRHPDLEVRIHPDPDRANLLDALTRNELDAIVLLDTGATIGDLGYVTPALPQRQRKRGTPRTSAATTPASTTGLEHLDLREIPMVAVAAPDHPLAGRPITREDLAGHGRLVGRQPRCSFWMATQRWLGPGTDITAVGGLAQVREWAANGQAVALLPDFTVTDDLTTGRLTRLDIATPPLQLRLIWQAHPQTHPAQPLLYALTQA